MSSWPDSLEYVNFRQRAYPNYHHIDDDYPKLTTQAINFVQQDLPTSVLRAKQDTRSLLELGIRQWTGFGAPRNKPAALVIWTAIASSREDIPLSLKARAYSSLALAFFEMAGENIPRNFHLDRLYDAGNNANKAIALGLISPATLKVAMSIEEVGLRRPRDDRFLGYSTERFERLTDLWEAFDTRKAEKAEEDLKREVKVAKDPLSYFCAAEDCGIVGTRKSALWKCSGGCPRVFKPSYCSRDCQKTDRKRHRPFCKPDATESSVSSTSGADAAVKRRPHPQEGTSPERFRPGAERAINVNFGGETVQISSSTMGPEVMREVREHLERMSQT